MGTNITDDADSVSGFLILIIRASKLPGLSCRPFCVCKCWTSVVHAASTNTPAAMLLVHVARWGWMSSMHWCYWRLWCAMINLLDYSSLQISKGPSKGCQPSDWLQKIGSGPVWQTRWSHRGRTTSRVKVQLIQRNPPLPQYCAEFGCYKSNGMLYVCEWVSE